MHYTKRLVIAFALSLLVHVALGFYLEKTPWTPGMIEGVASPENLMQVQLVPENAAAFDESGMGGDPNVRDDALRRTLDEEANRAPRLPDIPQQEWFSPESVAIDAPQEDLVAHADTEVSNLPGDLNAASVRSEIIKVPEPRVEAPEPDSRAWAPELSNSPPPSVNLEAPMLPAPVRDSGDLPDLPEPPVVLPPAVNESEDNLPAPLPPVAIPEEILSVAPIEQEGTPPDLPEDRVEFKEWDELLDVELTTYRPPKGSGFFRAVVTPNEEAGQLRAMSKDVLFAIDASGSMEGPVFEGLKQGLVNSLSVLRTGDRFNVLSFRADVIALNSGLWAATEKNLAAAKQFILDQKASGKTDIYRSVSAVVRNLPTGDRPFLIILCTDGRSTIGLQDSREIINALSVNNHLRAAIHVFGVGETVDRYLLRLLSYRNKGVARFASSTENIPKELESLIKELSDPILVGIQVDLSGMTEEESYPLVLPDLYRGGRIEFFGRFDREKEIALRLTGNVRGNLKEFVYRGDIPKPDPANAPIAEGWASAKAFHLVSRNLELGESEERTNSIRDLVRTFSLDIPTR
jgi:hypothetical protein